jgi:DNA repair protein RecO (recombination protein O)
MTESTEGIILRVRPLTETSLIIHWLTPGLGRLATVAKGARRPKSPFGGKLDLFYAADFSFSRSRHSELHLLREVSLRETHGAIRQDLWKLQQASYAAAFIEQVTELETPLTEFFALTRTFLRQLCAHPPEVAPVLGLELKLLRELGMEPDFTTVRLTPGSQKAGQALLADDGNLRLRLSGAQTVELQQFLGGFLAHHLGRLPSGRSAALAEPV